MAGPFDFTGQNIENTYQRLVQTDGTSYYDGTGSLLDLGGGAQDLQSVLTQGASTDITLVSTAETAISASGTGSFALLKATVIEGNSPLTLKDVAEINFDNADLFGNTTFHSDVNIYSGSTFLDEYDHEIFRSNASSQGTGNIQFGGIGLDTFIRGGEIKINAGASSQPSTDNIFIVQIEDDTKFTINNQGVTILGEQTSTPTAVEGGIYYSSSAFFVGVE